MLAVLLTLTLFLVWSAIGAAVLVAVRADTSDLRVILSAPILGTALSVLPLFMLSDAGVSMETAGPPVALVLLVSAVVVLAVRRPRLPLALIPVMCLALLDLALVGSPMFHFGFDWIANANGDMGFYVLAATQLLHHGLLSPVDLHSLAQDRNFSTSAQALDLQGIRPGAQITVASVSAAVGRSPLAVYMPMLLALNMSCVCAAGSLAMQASRRWWVASAAAALLVVSPLAAYGVVQQLMPQIWGLGLAVTLASWLMRPVMHQRPGPRIPDLIVVAILTGSLFVVYVEIASSLAIGYAIYVALLAARRRLSLRAIGILWGVPVGLTALVVNAYLSHEFTYIRESARFGVSTSGGGVRLFGYALVPSALPGITGLEELTSAPTTPGMGLAIVVAAALLIAIVAIVAVTSRKGTAAAVVLLGNAVLAAWLALKTNDFALFKTYMYVQPFIAAAIAAWLGGLRTRVALVAASAVLAAVMVVQVSRLNAYVAQSRNPVDLRHASGYDLLPSFRRLLASSSQPVVSVSDNFTLLELEGASAGNNPIYFLGRNIFNLPWRDESFRVPLQHGSTDVKFSLDRGTSKILSQGSCVLSLPSGTQLALNRRALPEGSSDLSVVPCSKARNILAFIASNRGQPPSLPLDNRTVSLWQLVSDPSFPGHTLSGFGRFALFQILGASPTVRVELTLTTSPLQRRDGSYRLPPAAAVGSARVRLPLVGSGSARVFSAPLRPKIIDGQPYLVLDMGEAGQLQIVRRPNLTGLWGRSVVIDPRFLTSYVRDISLVTSDAYNRLQPPRAIHEFPADLGNPDLEYSGIYEDGWVAGDSYVMLAGGRAGDLVLRASVLTQEGQHLRVLVDGRLVASRAVAPGELTIRVPVPRATPRRRIELRWTKSQRLGPADRRNAAALLQYLGIVPTAASKGVSHK